MISELGNIDEYRQLMEALFVSQEPAELPTITAESHVRFITSIRLPPQGNLVVFEPHRAYSIPQMYYQALVIDGVRMEDNFTSGSCRGLAFSENGILLLSKHVISLFGKCWGTKLQGKNRLHRYRLLLGCPTFLCRY